MHHERSLRINVAWLCFYLENYMLDDFVGLQRDVLHRLSYHFQVFPFSWTGVAWCFLIDYHWILIASVLHWLSNFRTVLIRFCNLFLAFSLRWFCYDCFVFDFPRLELGRIMGRPTWVDGIAFIFNNISFQIANKPMYQDKIVMQTHFMH